MCLLQNGFYLNVLKYLSHKNRLMIVSFMYFGVCGFPAFWLAGAGQPMRREACDNTHISLSSAVTTATEQSSLIEASRGELEVTAHNNHQSLSGSRRTLQYSILYNPAYFTIWQASHTDSLVKLLQYILPYLSEENVSLETRRLWAFIVRALSDVCRSLRVTRPSSSPDTTHTHTRQHQQSIMGLSSAYSGKWSRTVCDGAVLMRVPGDGRGAAAGRHHV